MGSSVCVCIFNFIWLLTGPNNQLIVEHFCFCKCLKLQGLLVSRCLCGSVFLSTVCMVHAYVRTQCAGGLLG